MYVLYLRASTAAPAKHTTAERHPSAFSSRGALEMLLEGSAASGRNRYAWA